MNNINQQKTKLCTNQAKQQRRKTMNKTMPTMILNAAIVASSITMPIQAAIIDQVKAKVNAIKVDTNALKLKTNSIQTQVRELGLTANAQIAESIDIRELLEPLMILKDMKAKFAGGGFDPADLLEAIDTDELAAKIDEMKQNREEMQQMVSDPGLEDFRQEYLEMLEGLNMIVAGDGPIEISPLQTFIERAPLPLIAALKVASEISFGPLRESIMSAVESLGEIQALGLLGVSAYTHINGEPKFVDANYAKAINVSSKQSTEEKICIAVGNFGINGVYSVLWGYQQKMLKIKQGQGKVNGKALKILRKIPKFPDLGVHGYLTIKLSGVDLPKHYTQLTDEQESSLEDAMDRNELWMGKLEWMQGSPEGACGMLPIINRNQTSTDHTMTVNRSL